MPVYTSREGGEGDETGLRPALNPSHSQAGRGGSSMGESAPTHSFHMHTLTAHTHTTLTPATH